MAYSDYVAQTWTDGSGGGTPVSAARLNFMETGITNAHYQPAVRVFHNANQSITSATFTALAFNSERIDQAGNAADTMHDTVTNNSRLTCRYAGVYAIGGVASFASNATGVRVAQVYLNNTTIIGYIETQAVNGDATVLNVSCLYNLAVNDFVELRCYQNSGGAVNVSVLANYSPEFWMVRVG